jgi:hypothetical protein
MKSSFENIRRHLQHRFCEIDKRSRMPHKVIYRASCVPHAIICPALVYGIERTICIVNIRFALPLASKRYT